MTVGDLRQWLDGKPDDANIGVSTGDGMAWPLAMACYWEQEDVTFRVVLGSSACPADRKTKG
jgi:hypothetical protein